MASTTTKKDNLLRTFSFIFWVLLVLAAAAVFLTLLILNLNHTIIVHVNSISLYPFDVSPSNISATWYISFSIENPNKKITISYDNIEASVFYHDNLLAATTLVPFQQGKQDKTFKNTTLSFMSLNIANWDGFEDMTKDKIRRGAVEFDIKMESLVRYHPNSESESTGWLRAYCDHLNIEFSSYTAAGLLGTSQKCKVEQK